MTTRPAEYQQSRAMALAVAKRQRRVYQLTQRGLSTAEIAEQLNICTRTVHRDRAAVGIIRPPNRAWTEDDDCWAKQLLADGASISETARTIGRSITAVQERFPGQGWTAEQTGEYNRMRKLKKQLGLVGLQ